MTKKEKIGWSIGIFAFIAIMVFGTFFDLEISKLLAQLSPGKYYSENVYAILGESFGENVLYILLVFALTVLYFYLKNFPLKKHKLNLFCQGICILFSVLVSFYCIRKTLEYLSLYLDIGLDSFISNLFGNAIIALISIIVVVITFLLFNQVKPKTLASLWKWALIVIVISALSNGIVQGGKLIFDRTRYRAMVFVGDTTFQNYTNWFQFNTLKFSSASPYAADFFKSFPSGHTCAAASSFYLILLPYFLPQTNNKKWKISFLIAAIVYTLLVAISRIIGGAHFFMDTFVGGMTTIILVLIAKLVFVDHKKLLTKKRNKKETK